jgi:mono/diheme cytochrome c family protein
MEMTFRQFFKFIAVFVLLLGTYSIASPATAQPENSVPAIEYNRDVLPIFAATCFSCHGSNESRRMAGLRLDTRDFVSAVVVPGDAEGSALYQRLTHGDVIRRMPPTSTGLSLSDEQIASVRRWINSGADLGRELSDAESDAMQIVERSIDFNREIRPVLSRNCFACHGPDDSNRQMGLRLDQLEGMLADRAGFGGPVIEPGDADASLLFQRISAEAEAYRMPRDRDALSADEIETVRLWINQGAEWESYWAFTAPEQPVPPAIVNDDWSRNPIDNFVLARLQQEGLQASPEADRATLIRRVTLDLTGLPPTLAEVDAFLADDSADAYATVVDRLLQSPAYGERMAVEWLDEN